MCKDEKRVYLYVFDIDECGDEVLINENIYAEHYEWVYTSIQKIELQAKIKTELLKILEKDELTAFTVSYQGGRVWL